MKQVLLLLPLALAACGGISQITPEQSTQVEKQLPAIDPPSGGQLCAFRVANFVGMGASCDIYANDEYIGRLPKSSYFCANLTPDEYVVTSKCFGGGRSGTEVNIKQGQRKFIEKSAANGTLINQTREVGLAGINETI